MKRRSCAGGPAETPDSNGIIRCFVRELGRVAKRNEHARSSWRGSPPRRARRSETEASRRACCPRPGRGRRAKPTTLPSRLHEMEREPASDSAKRGVTKSAAPRAPAGPLGYDQGMEITERPTETLLDLTPLAAAKIRELMAEEPDGESARPARRDPGRRLLRLPVRARLRHGRRRGRPRARARGRPRRRRPVQRPVPPGRDDRLPERPPGVRVQDRQPERRLLVRLRPLVPGGGGRGAPRGHGSWAAAAPAARTSDRAVVGRFAARPCLGFAA